MMIINILGIKYISVLYLLCSVHVDSALKYMILMPIFKVHVMK